MFPANVRRHALCALLIRCLFVFYGEYRDQGINNDDGDDAGLEPAYTDVDYWVFTDAARHICRGNSPYLRTTYRYSPLMAWLLVPGCYTPIAFGKLVFCVCDVVVGLMLWWLVDSVTSLGSLSKAARLVAACLWWYNPLPIGVASRGNGEAPAMALVLAALGCMARGHSAGAGTVLAIAVHLRLYPLVLVPAFYWSMATTNHSGGFAGGEQSLVDWLVYWVWPNRVRLRFLFCFFVCLSLLTCVCYHYYGWDYLEHALLYHLVRRDVRHNFSIFFYMLYLTEDLGLYWLSLAAFLPQLVVILALSVKFHRRHHLPFASFCCVFALVTFNKVYTSQYLLWYVSLLMACVPRLMARGDGVGVTAREASALLLLWYFAQGSWLLPAYLLEFDGRPVFRLVWAEGVALFCANVGIMARLIRKYDASSGFVCAEKGRCVGGGGSVEGHQKQS